MPSNRRAQPEAEKRAELISAARTLFQRDGYDTTPMNRIAQTAQVTPNTIYWYFRDKEQLLIAVLDELLQEHLQAYAAVAQAAPAKQLEWLVERLREVSGLVATVHSRSRESPALEQWHNRFHRIFESLFTARLPLPSSLSAAQRAAEMRVFAYSIEGMIFHVLEAEEIQQTCAALVARWLPPA